MKTPAGLALVLTALALVSVALYLPTIDYDFVWDDVSLIVNNPSLHDANPLDFFSQGFWHGAHDPPEGPGMSFYRPLTTLSFWTDLKLAGLNPGWFHLVNVIINALAVLMIALVLREILNSTIWAGIAGLLFATHPSHVESVAFVSGRTDLLLGLFIGMAAFGLLRALRRREFGWYALVPTGYLLALLSKETAVLFPALVLVAPLLTGTRYTLRHLAVTGVCIAITGTWLLLRTGAVGIELPLVAGIGPGARLAELANTFGLYLRIFAWPFLHQVKYPADPTFYQLTPFAIATLVFLVTIPLLAARRRYRVVLIGYVWTIIFLLPVANIIPIGPEAAERLLYLPSAGLFFIVVTLASRGLPGIPRLRVAAATLLLLLSVAYGIDSLSRSSIWRNEHRLYATMIREAPDAPGPYANLANVIAPEDPDSALTLYYKALARDQAHIRAHINVGILQSRLGDHRQSVHHLRVANELRPNSRPVLNNLGLAFLAAGRPDSALAYLNRAVAVEPKPQSVEESAGLLLNRSVALEAAGFPDSADAELRRLLEAVPDYLPGYLVFADRFEHRGLPDSAVRYLSAVTRLQPDRPEYHNRLGTGLVTLGDSTTAARSYERALELDPGFVPALYNQAVLSAARGDSAVALRLAERAWRLRPDVTAISALYRLLSGEPDREDD